MNPTSPKMMLQDALMMTVDPASVPEFTLPDGLDPIQRAQPRISLVSRRGMRALREAFTEDELARVVPPAPVFGPPRLVLRTANPDRPEMACLVCPVENHDEINGFVNALFQSKGLVNPEKRFVYHLTLANNAGGHPRGSIAYLNRSDFVGPEKTLGGPAAQRPMDPAWPSESEVDAVRPRPALR